MSSVLGWDIFENTHRAAVPHHRRIAEVVAAGAHPMIGRPARDLLSDDTVAGKTSDNALYFNWLASVIFYLHPAFRELVYFARMDLFTLTTGN